MLVLGKQTSRKLFGNFSAAGHKFFCVTVIDLKRTIVNRKSAVPRVVLTLRIWHFGI